MLKYTVHVSRTSPTVHSDGFIMKRNTNIKMLFHFRLLALGWNDCFDILAEEAHRNRS